MSIKMDLSKFKHLKSDDKTTTLQHSDGHTITLTHKALTPDNQKALKALSDMAKATAPTSTKPEAKEDAAQQLAKGGKVKRMAEGGDPSDNSDVAEDATADTQPIPNAPQQPDDWVSQNIPQPPPVPQQTAGQPLTKEELIQAMQMDPDAFRRGMNLSAGAIGPVGVEGAGMAQVETNAAKGLQSLEGKANFSGRGVSVPGKATPMNAFAKDLTPAQIGKVKVKPYAKGGDVKKMADGGAPDALAPNSPDNSGVTSDLFTTDPQQAMPAIDQAYKTGNENAIANTKKGLAYPSELDLDPSDDDPELKATQMVAEQQQQQQADKEASAVAEGIRSAKLKQARQSLGLDSPEAQDAPVSAEQTATGQAPQQQQSSMSDPAMDPSGGIAKGFNTQMQGINNEAQAKGDLGKAQAAVINQQLVDQNTAKATFQQHYNELDQERKAHIADIQNGYIDPDKYWKGDANGNGSHSKIAAGIGMILAGFNPTSNPNAAVNFLKYQMDQNMEAQKQNLGAKQNLLTANLHQFGNLKDATEMTRLMQNDILSHSLTAAAATAQTPMAKAQAMQAVGQLQRESAMAQQQFAMRRAMMNLANDPNGQSPGAINQMLGYMRVQNPEMAKEMEGRYVPGIGMASTPIPTEVRSKLTGFQNLNMQANDLYKFAQTHSTIIPDTPDYNVGAQKALALQSAVREGQLGTVYKAGEQPLLDKFVASNPAGAFKMLNSEPQLKEIIASNGRQMDILKKSYGLPVSQQSQPQGSQIKTVNGVKYMRGPNGQAIRVK